MNISTSSLEQCANFNPLAGELIIHTPRDLKLCQIAGSPNTNYDGTQLGRKLNEDSQTYIFSSRPTRRILLGLAQIGGQKLTDSDIPKLNDINIRVLLAFADIQILKMCEEPA